MRFDALIDYAPYAVQFRYIGADVGTGPLDRVKALGQVRALLEAVCRRLTDAEGA